MVAGRGHGINLAFASQDTDAGQAETEHTQDDNEREKKKESDRPPSGDEREARDETGLPESAFSPLDLYNESDDEVSPIIPSLEGAVKDGIVNWPFMSVNLNERYVDVEGVVGIDEGFLEQVACTPSTRGHESLVIAFARPSHIHAGLLLLGLEPGKPGKWEEVPPAEEGGKYTYRVIPPEGAKVTATVRYKKNDEDEELVEVPIREWIVDYETGRHFPRGPWIFGGSMIKKDFMDRDRYVADLTGSIMGLVTFGDETIGWSEVLPDQEAFWEPEWVCNTKIMPKWNTPVTLRIRPYLEDEDAGSDDNDDAGDAADTPDAGRDADAENADSDGQ